MEKRKTKNNYSLNIFKISILWLKRFIFIYFLFQLHIPVLHAYRLQIYILEMEKITVKYKETLKLNEPTRTWNTYRLWRGLNTWLPSPCPTSWLTGWLADFMASALRMYAKSKLITFFGWAPLKSNCSHQHTNRWNASYLIHRNPFSKSLSNFSDEWWWWLQRYARHTGSHSKSVSAAQPLFSSP